MPALVSEASRACMSCGRKADLFCGRCRVMPYCGSECQRKDWLAQHSLICVPSPRSAPALPTQPPTSPTKQTKYRNNDNFDKGKKTYYSNDKPNKPNYNNNSNNKNWQSNKKPFSQNFTKSCDPKPANDAASWEDAPQDNTPIENAPVTTGIAAKLRQPYDQKTEETASVASPAAQATPAPPPTFAASAKDPKTAAPLQPGKLADVLPTSRSQRTLVPCNYLVETLSVGDTFLLSVEKPSSECMASGSGFVCLSMHATQELNYELLCSKDFFGDCEKKESFKPAIGDLFSLHNKEDGCWYRARCVSPTHCALFDAGRIEPLADARCVRLSDKYAAIPEFSCILEAQGADVRIEQDLQATILSKSASGFKVTLAVVGTDVNFGEGLVSRWTTKLSVPVEAKVERPLAALAADGASILRPPVKTNSRVVIVDATETTRVFVRNADPETQSTFDNIVCDVALYGREAKPVTEPLKKGQIVVAKFTDGVHYRAVCLRTNVKLNKYKLEYIEYGNIHIAKMEDIYPCPSHLDLNAYPALASQVSLKMSKGYEFNEDVLKYVELLKDEVLLLTIPSGETSLPSGCEVCLTVASNNQSVNEKIELMSQHEWEKIGKDDQSFEKAMYNNMEYLGLEEGESEVIILDINGLTQGSLSMARAGHPQVDYAHKELAAKLLEYSKSELGSQQYLPCLEELCVVQSPADGNWYRAVFCHMEGAGSATGSVLYLDYGNLEEVPISALRKMPPSIRRAVPAVAVQGEIKGFPQNPTAAQLRAAINHLGINDEGVGKMRITASKIKTPGYYYVEAPSLLNAIDKA